MNKFVFPALLALCALMPACTTQQVYDSLQDYTRDNCQRLMEPDRSKCLQNNKTDYETYTKQRG